MTTFFCWNLSLSGAKVCKSCRSFGRTNRRRYSGERAFETLGLIHSLHQIRAPMDAEVLIDIHKAFKLLELLRVEVPAVHAAQADFEGS